MLGSRPRSSAKRRKPWPRGLRNVFLSNRLASLLDMSKVFIALSGGVDSSVAALLLKRAGFDISGVFMKFWKERENACCSLESERRARLVAAKLSIPFYVFDFKKDFKKKVVDSFLKESSLALTPNPCVVCNQEIKFGLFLKKALEMGADFIATGHYARAFKGKLLKAKDKEKDQSYFLYRLSQKQLSRVIFPIGDYTKKEVRKLAQKYKLPTAKAKESQNLCFLALDPQDFLKKNLGLKPGPIAEQVRYGVKKIIGRHPGLEFFTIGQRQGIGPNLFSQYQSQGPFYVLRKDLKKNQLVITCKPKDLLAKEFLAGDLHWVSGKASKMPFRAKVKIRSRQNQVSAIICRGKKQGQVLVKLAKPQKAITPGQSAVFYNGEELLGGGVIFV